MSPERAPLIVFSDDWGRHPSSCQHLVRRMLGHRRVLWVNTIGTRRPRVCAADLKRGVQKIRDWFRPPSPPGDERLRVLNPMMWPDCRGRFAQALNTKLISAAVNRAAREHLGGTPVVLTTVPLTASLVGEIPAARWIYYCVDDWSTWPGLDHAMLDSAERELLRKADGVAVVSDALAERTHSAGRSPMMITHGVDLETWRSPDNSHASHPVLQQLRKLPKPLAVFWGLIDGRFDAGAVRRLAARWSGSIALVGPVGEGAPDLRINRVHALQAVPYAALPHVAQTAGVLLMPYAADHAAVIASQPLKLKEYLSTDRAVVCLDIPAARQWADCCDVASGDAFVERVIHRAATGPSPAQLAARRERLSSESWNAKAQLLENLIDGAWAPTIAA